MKRFSLVVLFALVAGGLHSSTQAGTILLRDNFNSENGGVGQLGYSNFSNWTVMANNYDLLPAGGGPNPHPNHGLYVGLGSGWLISKQGLSLAPGEYQLKFDIAGRNQGVPNGVFVTLDNTFSDFFRVDSDSGFVSITRDFTITDQTNTYLFFDSGDNPALLDNVEIVTRGSGGPTIPEPATALLFGLTTAGAAGYWWRRRRAKA